MGPDTKAPPQPTDPDRDPFFYGWRMVPEWNDAGYHKWKKVPLTAWDVLHPEEDDFIMQTSEHDRDCDYLKDSLREVLRGRPGVEVFNDLRIDWQIPRLGVHGPDVVVFEGFTEPWAKRQGTLPVRDWGVHPLLIVEVVSPSTRDADLNDKVTEYHRAGVPVYVLVVPTEVGGRETVTVIGYQRSPKGYVRTPEQDGGVWVESVGLWFRPVDYRVACIDANGYRIPERLELTDQRDDARRQVAAVTAERDAEKKKADANKKKADINKKKAAAADKKAAEEKARADAAEQKMKDLEAELRRLRGE